MNENEQLLNETQKNLKYACKKEFAGEMLKIKKDVEEASLKGNSYVVIPLSEESEKNFREGDKNILLLSILHDEFQGFELTLQNKEKTEIETSQRFPIEGADISPKSIKISWAR